MWDRLKEAWATKKGGLVVLCWGTAITGVTLWSIQRRKYEREIEKDIIVQLPNSTFAIKSTYKLKKIADKEESKRVSKHVHNRRRRGPTNDGNKLESVNENEQFDEQFDEQSYRELHSEQMWSLWHLRKRIFPALRNEAVFYSISLPIFMGIWYFFRGKVKKQNSKLASYLTNKKWDKLFPATVDLALWSMPASICARIMTSFTSQLSISVRTNLLNYYTNKYLSKKCSLYQVNNVLDYCDQRLCNDIEKFSNEFAQLYNAILWSFGGVIMLSISLMSKMGIKEFMLAIGYAMISRQIVSQLSPSFSDLTELLQLSEARFRGFHSKIVEYCEEIEILGGGDIEKTLLQSYWKQVEYATKNFHNCTMISQMFGSYFTGEIGNLVGYIAMVPAIYFAQGGSFKSKSKSQNNSNKTGNKIEDELDDSASGDTVAYLTSIVQELSFLTKLFEKVFRIGNKWHEVNGFAHRIVELEKGLKNTIETKSHRRESIVANAKPKENEKLSILLDNITIATPKPNSDVLIRNLTLQIDEGYHTFIEGPNGVGKTSIFRIIGGLWQPYNQEFEPTQLKLPNNKNNNESNLFLLSQRPYLVNGLTFREQLFYPKTKEQMLTFLKIDENVTNPTNDESNENNNNDSQYIDAKLDQIILGILQFVGLKSLVLKRGGLDSFHICDGLSGGEKQRVGMARCLLHKPKFALLDECSSAVSVDLEEKFFEKCIENEMTLITIAHNKALKRFHKQCLQINDDQTWQVTVFNIDK